MGGHDFRTWSIDPEKETVSEARSQLPYININEAYLFWSQSEGLLATGFFHISGRVITNN